MCVYVPAPGDPRDVEVVRDGEAVRAFGAGGIGLELLWGHVVAAVVGGENDHAGVREAGVADRVHHDLESGIAVGEGDDLFGRAPAVFMTRRVGVRKMNEAEVRLEPAGERVGKGLRDGLRFDFGFLGGLGVCRKVGQGEDKGVHRAGKVEVAELYLANEHRGGEAVLFGDAEDGRHGYEAEFGFPVVPEDVVFERSHAGEHRRVRRQGDARHDRLRGPSVGAFGGHGLEHGHVALGDDRRFPAVEADDENVFGSRGGGASDRSEQTAEQAGQGNTKVAEHGIFDRRSSQKNSLHACEADRAWRRVLLVVAYLFPMVTGSALFGVRG